MSLPGDDDRRALGALVESDRGEHQLGAGQELPTERRQPRSEPTARTGSGEIAERKEIDERGQPRFELLDRRLIRSLLRPEDPCCAASAEERALYIARDAQRNRTRPGMKHLAQAGTAVDGGRATDTDEDGPRLLAQGREEQLADASGRSTQRVELGGSDQREPHRSRGLYDGSPVRKHQPAGVDRAVERPRHDLCMPVAAEHVRPAPRQFPRRRRRPATRPR